MWLVFALASACFAGVMSILAKIGVKNTDSDLATALRTVVVLVFAWLMVFVAGSQHSISEISMKSLIFLVLSGFATGLSWLCFYRALQLGPASLVVPIDKLSILITTGFSFFVLRERLSPKAVLGLGLIVAGTLVLLI